MEISIWFSLLQVTWRNCSTMYSKEWLNPWWIPSNRTCKGLARKFTDSLFKGLYQESGSSKSGWHPFQYVFRLVNVHQNTASRVVVPVAHLLIVFRKTFVHLNDSESEDLEYQIEDVNDTFWIASSHWTRSDAARALSVHSGFLAVISSRSFSTDYIRTSEDSFRDFNRLIVIRLAPLSDSRAFRPISLIHSEPSSKTELPFEAQRPWILEAHARQPWQFH